MTRTVKIWDTLKRARSCRPWEGPWPSDIQRGPKRGVQPGRPALASGSADETVKIWDVATGNQLFSLKGHAEGITSVAFSSDNKHLASRSCDQTVKIWDSGTGKELFSHKSDIHGIIEVHATEGLAFSPNGRRA